ncbi:transmembrane protein [Nitzschia inconspicua]|uniref:Transmembrane protein n=1 Tax=Nitzschia inconspicua TaxID=303405 RepID=A0A9K3PNS8_9STRA|nr:transmembrane protein [Nitzschia inconspicua]
MAPPGSAHLNFTLGGLVAVGGAVGYFKKGSVPSLVAGLTFGGLLIGSGVLITQGESYKGHVLASGVTGLMTLAMGQRFLASGKFMPAGMVATLGAAGLAYNAKKAIEWMPEKSD